MGKCSDSIKKKYSAVVRYSDLLIPVQVNGVFTIYKKQINNKRTIITKSPCYIPETNATLQINYIPI